MEMVLIGVAAALWLGVLASISPCPLATNIAAISFIGRRIDNARFVFLDGLPYTLGRTLSYLVLGILLVNSLLPAPGLFQLLQKYMDMLLGRLFILVDVYYILVY